MNLIKELVALIKGGGLKVQGAELKYDDLVISFDKSVTSEMLTKFFRCNVYISTQDGYCKVIMNMNNILECNRFLSSKYKTVQEMHDAKDDLSGFAEGLMDIVETLNNLGLNVVSGYSDRLTNTSELRFASHVNHKKLESLLKGCGLINTKWNRLGNFHYAVFSFDQKSRELIRQTLNRVNKVAVCILENGKNCIFFGRNSIFFDRSEDMSGNLVNDISGVYIPKEFIGLGKNKPFVYFDGNANVVGPELLQLMGTCKDFKFLKNQRKVMSSKVFIFKSINLIDTESKLMRTISCERNY